MSNAFVENTDALKSALPTGSPRLLLDVACTTKYEAHNFQMYPEVSSFDFTQGTNDQNNSLLMRLNYGGNLQSNVHTRMFILSEMRWVSEFIADHALTCIHVPHASQATQVNIFDED